MVVSVLVVVFALTRVVNGVFVSIRDGELLQWLLALLTDSLSHGLMAAVMLALVVPVINLGPRAGWTRIVALIVAVAVAAPICAAIRMEYLVLVDGLNGMGWADFPRRFLGRWSLRYGLLGAALTAMAEFHRREVASVEAMHRAEMDRLALDRQMAEARLQVLQAQIEPHFLFNTLANVRRLYQTDLAGGRSMLENLMRYLEVALPRMRENTSTLEREAALIEAYLNVQQIRMGRRLAFEIDMPDALRDVAVPPMMLLTLVENAIKHGLNPLLEGGFVRIAATGNDQQLQLAVADTGRGFGEGTSGGGTGLANIRARLVALYGSAASLALTLNTPRGITATIALPMDLPRSPATEAA
jgi:hypothetical protein